MLTQEHLRRILDIPEIHLFVEEQFTGAVLDYICAIDVGVRYGYSREYIITAVLTLRDCALNAGVRFSMSSAIAWNTIMSEAELPELLLGP